MKFINNSIAVLNIYIEQVQTKPSETKQLSSWRHAGGAHKSIIHITARPMGKCTSFAYLESDAETDALT